MRELIVPKNNENLTDYINRVQSYKELPEYLNTINYINPLLLEKKQIFFTPHQIEIFAEHIDNVLNNINSQEYLTKYATMPFDYARFLHSLNEIKFDMQYNGEMYVLLYAGNQIGSINYRFINNVNDAYESINAIIKHAESK